MLDRMLFTSVAAGVIYVATLQRQLTYHQKMAAYYLGKSSRLYDFHKSSAHRVQVQLTAAERLLDGLRARERAAGIPKWSPPAVSAPAKMPTMDPRYLVRPAFQASPYTAPDAPPAVLAPITPDTTAVDAQAIVASASGPSPWVVGGLTLLGVGTAAWLYNRRKKGNHASA